MRPKAPETFPTAIASFVYSQVTSTPTMPTPSPAKTPANGRGFIYMPAGAEIAIGYRCELLRHFRRFERAAFTDETEENWHVAATEDRNVERLGKLLDSAGTVAKNGLRPRLCGRLRLRKWRPSAQSPGRFSPDGTALNRGIGTQ